MADLAALLVKKNQLIEEIALSVAAKDSANRAAQQAENNLQFTTNPRQRQALQGQISSARAAAAREVEKITRLNIELAEVNSQINLLQQQAAPQQSTGQTVREDQAARSDAASVSNPPPPLEVLANGRVAPAQDRPPSNAQRPGPGAVDAGTNAATRRASNTQSIPPITAAPGPIRPAASGPYATQTTGARSSTDDNPGATAVRARLNALFGKGIEAQNNVLDQYASYSYNISVYLMSPADYTKLIKTKKKTVAGFQLLFMSGGAGPAGTKTAVPALSRQERDFVTEGDLIGQSLQNLGRNEFFSLDYYIDDLQVKSLLSGKGTGGAHNVTELKFKVIEPNGITFLDNLFAATQQYIKASGGDINKNYSAQNYLMVIRFYGYDQQGNLVKVTNAGQDSAGTDVNAIVEKFIPFQFTGIKFRIANKIVEYECSAVCPQNNVNTGASRGVVPYNIELQSQTLKDLLTGTPKFAANDREGRVTPTAAQPAAGARTLTNDVGLGQISDTPAA
jgi:hypothetical protein